MRAPCRWLILISLCAVAVGASSAPSRFEPTKGMAEMPSANANIVDPSSPASLSSASRNEIEEDDSGILPASIAVGTITAAMGFVYGKLLSQTVHTLWKTFPEALTQRGIDLNPVYFITGICTFGGLLMGIASSSFSTSYTVADFVSAFSAAPGTVDVGQMPRSRSSLFPLLFLSLITSTFGFSVGPEAPMVCAGGLVGASFARRMYGDPKIAENLAYAGAAGALTAFMGIPIAGSVFALELTRSSAGLSSEALSPAVAASVAALVLIRAFLIPNVHVGGHFAYGLVGSLSGRTMMLTALASSVMGAGLGTIFHKAVAFLKKVLWYSGGGGSTDNKNGGLWKREVAVKTTIGLAVGLLSSYYPQTLFWGEGSLQTMVDGQTTPFSATKHGLGALLTSAASVNPSLPFETPKAALKIGIAKLVAIILACAGKFPGGIIFPLFFAAAPFAHACSSWLPPSVMPVLVICTMAATQASVTRTPLATALILSLSASATTELSVMLPACLVASYFSVYLSQLISKKSYFKYSK